MILFSNEETLQAMNKMAHQSDEILISTFGIWAGIKQGQVLEFSSVFKLLQGLKGKNVSILVGKPRLVPCNGIHCEDCVTQNKNAVQRILLHTKHWPSFKWTVSDEIHTKAFLVKHGNKWSGIAGSRNLSGSSWEEAMFILDTKDALTLSSKIRSLLK